MYTCHGLKQRRCFEWMINIGMISQNSTDNPGQRRVLPSDIQRPIFRKELLYSRTYCNMDRELLLALPLPLHMQCVATMHTHTGLPTWVQYAVCLKVRLPLVVWQYNGGQHFLGNLWKNTRFHKNQPLVGRICIFLFNHVVFVWNVPNLS